VGGRFVSGAAACGPDRAIAVLRALVPVERAQIVGIDSAVPAGYENLNYTVRIKGNGTKAQFAEIHQAVMATSPNFYNMSKAVRLKPELVVE